MRQTCRLCTLFFCLVVLPGILRAQTQPANPPALVSSTVTAGPNPKIPEEFFARARQLSDLEAAGIPFHLKATYVATGDAEFTGNGTIEEWWQSKDVWKKEATLGGYRWVLINSNGKTNFYTSSAYVPLRLRQAVGALPIQFPSEVNAASDWKADHKKLGRVGLIMLSKRYSPQKSKPHIQVVRAYYLTSEGVLRAQQDGDVSTVYNNFQPFQNLLIPWKINIGFGTNQLVIISIDLLEKLKQNQQEMSLVPSLPQNVPLSEVRLKIMADAMRSKMVYSPSPEYPLAARQQRMQGTVVIGATIDRNGNIREPYILTSAGQLLNDAALKAIRKWRYNPVMIDGKPNAVETTISVIFALSY